VTLNAPVLAGRKDDEEDNVDVEEGAEEAPEPDDDDAVEEVEEVEVEVEEAEEEEEEEEEEEDELALPFFARLERGAFLGGARFFGISFCSFLRPSFHFSDFSLAAAYARRARSGEKYPSSSKPASQAPSSRGHLRLRMRENPDGSLLRTLRPFDAVTRETIT
jgi:hypothetical protein